MKYFYDRYNYVSYWSFQSGSMMDGGTHDSISGYPSYSFNTTNGEFSLTGSYTIGFISGILYSMSGNQLVETSINPSTRQVYYATTSTTIHRYKSTYIDTIMAEDGTYPNDGISGSYWYIKGTLAANPSIPGAITGIAASTFYEANLSLGWGVSTDTEGNPITYALEVSRNGSAYVQIYTGAAIAFTYLIAGSNRGETIQFRVKSLALGVSSEYRYSLVGTKNNIPSVPGAMTYPTLDVTIKRESKTIAWIAATDDQTAQASLQYETSLSIDGSTYTVIRAFATGVSFSYDFTGASINKNFSYDNCLIRVRTKDSFGVISNYVISSKFKIHFPEAPTIPGLISGAATKAERLTMNLSWVASTDINTDIITYLVQFWDRSSWVTLSAAQTGLTFNHVLPSVLANYADYKYRVRATDATGLSSDYKESNVFSITQDSPPTLTTDGHSLRTTTTARAAGTISNLGGYNLTQYGHCWALTANPTTTNSKTSLGTKSAIGTFSSDLAGLAADVVYYVRAYATNVKGTSYGAQIIIPKYYPRLAIRSIGIGIGMIPTCALDVNGDTGVSGELYIAGTAMKAGLTATNSALTAHTGDVTYQMATGTATAITLATSTLTDGYAKTFIASATNTSTSKTINGKPFYKPGTVLSPSLTIGKAYTVWYKLANDCFFIKASAEGTALVADVLAGHTFSNDNDVGLSGSIIDRGTVNITPSATNQTIAAGKHSGSGIVYGDVDLIAANILKDITIFNVVGTVIAGKRWASGSIAIAAYGTATVTGLTFNPATIITSMYSNLYYSMSSLTPVYGLWKCLSATTYAAIISAAPANGSFIMNNSGFAAATTINWIAIE